ncbi:response regulator transcription factor [Conexibacter sp. DBS9H8]|uniref:response regulator transcription factor n=1 Tax=Conexibacter sp. DBS9H8 TaxID=2937801 RepID=UPI00200E6B0B|nr:response regulator transcription factor [Conexibacter sp. DBS9H8]
MNCNCATILITGPNRAARAYVGDNLTADGHDVRVAPTVETAWQMLAADSVDLVIVDLSDFGRYDRAGLEFIGRVRQPARLGAGTDAAVPIISLAPRLGELERVRVLERGSDDLLQIPYAYAELRARVAALLRRAQGEWRAGRIRVGPLEIDAGARQAWMDARPLPLTAKELALLTVLASRPTQVFTRGELLERVWGFAPDDRSRTVDVHASRLRRKLAHPRERFVVNAWGEGYKLVTALSGGEPADAWEPADVAEIPERPASRRVAAVA